MDSYQVILNPIITERSLLDRESGKYAFKVDNRSTKYQIAQAFKTIFGITPLSINTIFVKGKDKTNWKTKKAIHKPDQKKAIITIPKDKKIEILQLKEAKK